MRLEEIIHKWFEMKVKTYNRLEYEDSIYLYYEDEEYADIRIDKKEKYVYYRRKLYEDFSHIIFINSSLFEIFMSKWVYDTFGLTVFTSDIYMFLNDSQLKIPKIDN